MARSKETFSKRDREKKRQKKRQDKLARKEERKENSKGGGLDGMIVYVDENGNFTDAPPDPSKKKKIKLDQIEVSVPKMEDIEPEIRIGKVDYFNHEKGFGFIREQDTGDKYFFHIKTVLYDQVNEGDKVTYDIEQGPKGLNAVQVEKVE